MYMYKNVAEKQNISAIVASCQACKQRNKKQKL